MKYAIDRGYRHIDTGLTYGSEKDIGVALKEKIAEGVIKREDMFITTKVMPNEDLSTMVVSFIISYYSFGVSIMNQIRLSMVADWLWKTWD